MKTKKTLSEARLKHNKFLESMGIPLKINRKLIDRSYTMEGSYLANYVRSPDVCSNTIVSGGYKRTVDDYKWRRDRGETSETIKAIEHKKTRIAPLYNKGSTQYITDAEDPQTLGKKV
jgi:hypothetical protein